MNPAHQAFLTNGHKKINLDVNLETFIEVAIEWEPENEEF